MAEVDLAIWMELYGLAGRVRGLAPWMWMDEAAIFGVETRAGDTAFISVMGTLGEHLAIAVYPDAAALDALKSFLEETIDPSRLLEIPHLQLAFEDRQELRGDERALIGRLGLRFRGKQAWPVFRSYRPGYFPWILEAGEAETLRVALSQALDVAGRLRSNPSLLDAGEPDRYLTRVPDPAVPDGWKDTFRRVPPPPASLPRPVLDAETASRYLALPQAAALSLELDFFPVGARIGSSGERAALPYCLLIVESGRGLIVGHEMMTVQSTMNALLESVPLRALEALGRYGARPEQVVVRHGRLAAVLRSSCETLGIQLRTRRQLAQLDPAKENLLQFMRR